MRATTFGEVMVRLTTPRRERFNQARVLEMTFGGAEANVAVSLAILGDEARYVTRLPRNDIAETCIQELRGFGVDTRSILRGGDRIGNEAAVVASRVAGRNAARDMDAARDGAALRLGPSVADPIKLELGKGQHHSRDELPRRRRRVEVAVGRDDHASGGLNLLDRLKRPDQASGEAVDLGDDDPSGDARLDPSDRLREFGAVELPA